MKVFTLSAAFALCTTVSAYADGILYFGMGDSKTASSTQNGDTPFSFGYLGLKDEGISYGFDIGFEGTVLDSTYRQNSVPNQAKSYNLIVATNLSNTGSRRLDVGALIGFRESTKDCPNSYLGYACYANTTPDIDYEMNFGGIVTYSFESFSLGLRAASESSQFLIGTRF